VVTVRSSAVYLLVMADAPDWVWYAAFYGGPFVFLAAVVLAFDKRLLRWLRWLAGALAVGFAVSFVAWISAGASECLSYDGCGPGVSFMTDLLPTLFLALTGLEAVLLFRWAYQRTRAPRSPRAS
jgi:hypothetical protein